MTHRPGGNSKKRYLKDPSGKMDILLSEPVVRRYVDQYFDFLIESVIRLQAFCDGKIGATPQQYADRVDGLEDRYNALIKDVPATDVSFSMFRSLCKRLRDATSQRRDTNEIAEACEKLLRQFIYNDEENFRRAYLNGCAVRAMQEMYSDRLFVATKTQLDNGKYDAAIVEAFKCLDSHIQRILKLLPGDQQFGEKLINTAFGDSGQLKLNADPSEQKGLRNFASGANAVFRNPVAHRSVFTPDLDTLAKYLLVPLSERPPSFYDSIAAQTAIAVVALLMKISTVLALQNGIIAKEKAPDFPFGVRRQI